MLHGNRVKERSNILIINLTLLLFAYGLTNYDLIYELEHNANK